MRPVILLSLLALAGPALAQGAKPAVGEPPVLTAFETASKDACEGLPGCEFVLLAGDPAAGPSQWFFRLAAGTPFPKHWHSTPESMVPIQGALTFNFELGDPVTIRAGEHLRYQAGMIHWGQCEPGEDCLYYVFNDQPYDFHAAQ